MAADLEIRHYQPGDEVQLTALFRRCFGREISLAHWRWKMQGRDFDARHLSVAQSGGRIVGQYVGAPVCARVAAQDRRAIAIFDTMVDPAMRRQGVLSRVGAHAHSTWRDMGIAYGFGLPNEQWGSRAAALGWVPLFRLCWLLRVLRPESILARRTGIGSLRRLTPLGDMARRLLAAPARDPEIRIERIDVATAELDTVAERLAGAGAAGVRRGSCWVEHRYLRCPSRDYQVLLASRGAAPVGYAVFSMGAAATVTEIIGVDDAASFSLLADIEGRCLESGAESIRALAVPQSDSYRLLRRCAYRPRRAAFTLQYVPLQEEVAALRDPGDWQFQGGDFDVV